MEAGGGGGTRHVGAPRTLDVQKFANARGAEVHALHAALKERRGADGPVEIPRCLRRRTTSHNRRKSFFWQRKQKKKRCEDENQKKRKCEDEAEEEEREEKVACRRVRRRIELKGDAAGGGGCARDGTQRLVTHVWHAKRFTMGKCWGHWLPEGLPGRGRGSRAVVRWAKEAAVLQDASFYSAIELEGSGDSISRAMQLVLEPAPLFEAYSRDRDVHSGAKYGKAMLHHINRFPRGAIAPVTFMWKPESTAGEERRMWLWVHAAAFEEAFSCLQHLCQSQGLQCWSRKGQLGRLDLFGSKAASVLQKVLHPVSRQEATHPSSCDSSASLEDSSQFPGCAVIGMEVWDPRDRSHSDTTFQPSLLVDDEMEVEDMDIANSNSGCGSNDVHVDVKRTRGLAPDRLQLVGNREMWDRLDILGQSSIAKPSSEKDLSTRRHKERLNYIQLSDNTNEGPSAATESLKCPILILKHAHERPSACGFSIILPIAWVRAFWVPLVFAGGHVIGLRERHWLDTDSKLFSFPHDFPDCSSYDQYMARMAAEEQESYNRRPPSKRGIWKSGQPDWNFENEASPLYPGGVSRAESGAEAVCENSEGKTTVCPSSTGPDAPSNPNTGHNVPTSGAGMTEAVVSMNPSNEVLVPPTSAEIIPRDDPTVPASIEAPNEGHISDHTRENHPPQLDLVSDSQPLASITNQGCYPSTVDMEASTSQEVSKQIDNPSTLKDESVQASEGGDKGKSSMFVARTIKTVQKVLQDDDLHHLPLLTGVRSSKPLKLPGLQLVGDGSSELAKRGCLVNVLIHAPRKGVLDSGAIIYLPHPSDVDSYFSSSQRWQGFDDPSFKQVQQSFLNKKKRKQKAKGEKQPVSASTQPQNPEELPEPTSESHRLRVPIGIVTSGSVRGSTSSAAIGVCELAALGVQRAKQRLRDREERSSPNSEVFVLARNASSSMYRPALMVEFFASGIYSTF